MVQEGGPGPPLPGSSDGWGRMCGRWSGLQLSDQQLCDQQLCDQQLCDQGCVPSAMTQSFWLFLLCDVLHCLRPWRPICAQNASKNVCVGYESIIPVSVIMTHQTSTPRSAARAGVKFPHVTSSPDGSSTVWSALVSSLAVPGVCCFLCVTEHAYVCFEDVMAYIHAYAHAYAGSLLHILHHNHSASLTLTMLTVDALVLLKPCP